MRRSRLTLFILLLVFVAIWQLLSQTGAVSRLILATPSSAVEAMAAMLSPNSETPGGFYQQVQVTLYEIAAGYLIASITGVALGFLLGYYRLLGDVMEPLVNVVYALPWITLYPIMFFVLGIGPTSKIALASFLAVFPITLSTLTGVRQVERSYIRYARSVGCSAVQMMFRVIIPASIPAVISGLRQGIALAIIGGVAGEMIASSTGLGFLITWSSNLLKTDYLYGLILIVTLLAVGLNYIFSRIESRIVAHY